MIVDLHMNSKHVLVIGGGNQATKKIQSLYGEGCTITAISPKFTTILQDMARAGHITIHAKEADTHVLREVNPDVVIAATDNHTLNRDIMKAAKGMGVMRYSVSDPLHSDYAHLAILKFKDLVRIAVSTNGKSPTMSKRIRTNIESNLTRIITDDIIHNIQNEERITH